MPPPPAEQLATRIFLGPALRAQPDRRLVTLVREGYEAAFEEIVRRYRKPLDRFAAAIVGGRSEDVTQDAFSKALLALRGTSAEIELKPWLYRIVRNTALNDLRDGPPPTEELGEAIAGGHSAAVEVERREEIGQLMGRLRALPEPQRAAIVMRELEGLSHEEIAAALGVSGGAARQAIYRARLALRDGLGLLLPLPLLRMLFDHGAEAAGASAGGVAAAGAATAAGGGGGATLGGLGAGGALKVGVATVLVAGSVGAGVAIQQERGNRGGPEPAEASATQLPAAGNGAGSASSGPPSEPSQAPLLGSGEGRGRGGSGSGDEGGRSQGPDHRNGHGVEVAGDDLDDSSQHGGGPGPGSSAGHGGHGSRHGGRPGSSGDDPEDRSGEEILGGSHSGRHGSDGRSASGSGSGHGGTRDEGGGGEDSHGDSGSGSGGHGGSVRGGSDSSDDPAAVAIPAPAPEPPPGDDGDSSEERGSGSGGDGRSGSGPGGGEDDS